MDKNYLSFKIIIVGQQSVGKTALAYNYVKGEFKHDYNVTVGVEFSSKSTEIYDTTVQMQIWDTAGLEAFGSVVRTFYKGACAVLLVYAIDSVSSFEALKHWTKEVKEHAHEQVCIFLVGTKLDLEARREVNRKDAERFMKYIGGSLFVETSSKTSENVQEVHELLIQLFERVANTVYKKYRISAAFRYLVNPGADDDDADKKQRATSFSLRRPSHNGQRELQKKSNNCC